MHQVSKSACLILAIGAISLVTLVLPVFAISPRDIVEFHVEVHPDEANHAIAQASLFYYKEGSDEYVRVEVSWGKASIGGAVMMFQIGREFTIIETNHSNPENHITVAWHPWWLGGFPLYAEGSRIVDASLSPAYYASYYLVAKRVENISREVWVELSISVKTYYYWDSDYDWQSLSLPVPPPLPYNNQPYGHFTLPY